MPWCSIDPVVEIRVNQEKWLLHVSVGLDRDKLPVNEESMLILRGPVASLIDVKSGTPEPRLPITIEARAASAAMEIEAELRPCREIKSEEITLSVEDRKRGRVASATGSGCEAISVVFALK